MTFMKKVEGRRVTLGHWHAAAFIQLGAGLTFNHVNKIFFRAFPYACTSALPCTISRLK